MTNLTILSRDSIADRIKALAASAISVQDEAHILAVSTLDHIREFGDFRGAVLLVNSLPKSLRREALAVWFEEYTNSRFTLRLNKDTGKFEGKLRDRTEDDFRVAEAAGTPFWDLTPEKRPGNTLSLEKFLAMLKGKATNDKLNDDGTPKVAPEVRDMAHRLYNEALKVMTVAPAPAPAPAEAPQS